MNIKGIKQQCLKSGYFIHLLLNCNALFKCFILYFVCNIIPWTMQFGYYIGPFLYKCVVFYFYFKCKLTFHTIINTCGKYEDYRFSMLNRVTWKKFYNHKITSNYFINQVSMQVSILQSYLCLEFSFWDSSRLCDLALSRNDTLCWLS